MPNQLVIAQTRRRAPLATQDRHNKPEENYDRAKQQSAAPVSVCVHVPMKLRKISGRKCVITPDNTPWLATARYRPIDNALVKAIARAFRWREMIENGTCATIAEIAASEKISESYVGRVLRLTLLAPDIVEAILDGRQPPEMTLAMLMKPFPVAWGEQVEAVSGPSSKRGS